MGDSYQSWFKSLEDTVVVWMFKFTLCQSIIAKWPKGLKMTWSLRGVYMALMDKVHLALIEPQPRQHPFSLQLKHEATTWYDLFWEDKVWHQSLTLNVYPSVAPKWPSKPQCEYWNFDNMYRHIWNVNLASNRTNDQNVQMRSISS